MNGRAYQRPVEGRTKETAGQSAGTLGDASSPYLSPRELAERWRCARPTVHRIAERAGLTRLYLGEGRNGMVRYLRREVEAYEASRSTEPR